MCANAGKELCTNAQWQAAASGTPDPGNGITIPYGGSAQDACNVNSNGGRGNNAGTSGTPATTLAHVDCVSTYGAYDLIGNLSEATADWLQVGPTIGLTAGEQVSTTNGSGAGPWPTGYGDGADSTWNLNGEASDPSGFVGGLPGTSYRGGAYNSGANAGAFALYAGDSPASTYVGNGARCCARGR